MHISDLRLLFFKIILFKNSYKKLLCRPKSTTVGVKIKLLIC